MEPKIFYLLSSGIVIGILASFSGLGGGFLMVPLLLFLGFSAQKSVGTSFIGIFIISLSALFAHNKLANLDFKYGILLGIGGIIGAQIGAHLVMQVSTENFRKIFACILFGLAIYLFTKKS